MSYERHLHALARESAALAAAARSGLAATVPSCPEWSVQDLVAHVGHGFRVVAGIVRDHADAEVSWEPLSAPAEGVVEWFEESSAELVEALTNESPDTPVWNWSERDGTVAFWARRMAHEVAVHRWDAEWAASSGSAASPVEPEQAADGVDEMLTVYYPVGLAEEPVDGLAGTFSVVSSDTPDAWYGRLRPDSIDVVRGVPASRPDATLEGPASDLLLALWGRPVAVTARGDARIVTLLTS